MSVQAEVALQNVGFRTTYERGLGRICAVQTVFNRSDTGHVGKKYRIWATLACSLNVDDIRLTQGSVRLRRSLDLLGVLNLLKGHLQKVNVMANK